MTNQPKPYGERAERLREMAPALIADLRLYATEQGGKKQPAFPGWGCPCMVEKTAPKSGWEGLADPVVVYDAWPLLGEDPLYPGQERRVGFVFLSPEGAAAMLGAGHFYLWEGNFVGEAHIVST
jgi:hypothetical protein